MRVEFKDVEVGARFENCGADYEKKSSRTAWLLNADGTYCKWFYFGQREVVKLIKENGMKQERVANKNARRYVQNLEPFIGSNTEGVWRRDPNTHKLRYVVTSYGTHWPLFIWDDGVWYENADKYSVSTSKHRSQLHPLSNTVPMSVRDMVCLQYYGIGGVAAGQEVDDWGQLVTNFSHTYRREISRAESALSGLFE